MGFSLFLFSIEVALKIRVGKNERERMRGKRKIHTFSLSLFLFLFPTSPVGLEAACISVDLHSRPAHSFHLLLSAVLLT